MPPWLNIKGAIIVRETKEMMMSRAIFAHLIEPKDCKIKKVLFVCFEQIPCEYVRDIITKKLNV